MRWDSPTQQLQLRYRLTEVSVASATRPGLGTSARAGAGRRTVAAFGSLLGGMRPICRSRWWSPARPAVADLPPAPASQNGLRSRRGPAVPDPNPIPFSHFRVLVQYDRPAR